jgi:hypothetical protein
MKRLLANLALTAILSTLVLPLGVALETSSAGTPVCCLPGGKHHCTERPSGAGLTGKSDGCPYASKFLATGFTGLHVAKFEFSGAAAAGRFAAIAAFANYRIAGRQPTDRGPPAFSF